MTKTDTKQIRNVCFLGHGGSGKTSVAEAMLYIAKETDRLGTTSDGNTVCDYDPEEIKRGFSLQDASCSCYVEECENKRNRYPRLSRFFRRSNAGAARSRQRRL